ncbi:hypothetical protein GIB67_028610 [Kingdonia uniflora]|uniref:Uncharacterized protein n=1 Tax=Kingdonia uniflora TaxID=39325 RepID=A0A7J7KZQ1_9MAGN|nr:hypothetical protein GIB67_028610 [Kingdonia uniflora]
MIQLNTKIPKKGLANRVPKKRRTEFLELENIQSTAENLLQQVTPGKGLEVVKDLMVDDDVEVNLEAISSKYGGGLLEKSVICSNVFGIYEWKKSDEKDNDDNINVEENVKFEEEQPQVVEEEDSEPPTVVVYYNGKKDIQHVNETMVVAEVAKTDIVFFNQEEVVGEAYQASADQTTTVSVEDQTLDNSADQTTVVSVEEQIIEVAQTEVVISHQEEDVGKTSQSKECKEEVEHNKEEVVEGKDDDDENS